MNMGESSAGEKDVGGDKVRTVRESSFIWGGQAGYTRNGKTNRKREFTGPRFTTSIILETVCFAGALMAYLGKE